MEIMEFLEPEFPNPPMLPEDKSLAALTHLIHSFGSEGLTKSSMYLRWNTTFANRMFARNEFQRTMATPEIADEFAVAMRNYLPILGVTLDHGVDVAKFTFSEVSVHTGRCAVIGRLRLNGANLCTSWSRHSVWQFLETAGTCGESLD
jgi:hypothetical protein